MRDFRHPPQCKLELPIFICRHDELASHPCNKLDRLPFAMYGYHIDACSDLRIKLEYLKVYISRWTLFTTTYRVGLSSYLQQVGLSSYVRINLNCFLISMSVWTVFISKYQFGLSSQLHVWSSTVLIATYQVVLSSYLRIKLLVFPHTYQNKMSLYYISSWIVFLYSYEAGFFSCLHTNCTVFISAYQMLTLFKFAFQAT